jgi:hypothetical protein
MLLTATVLVTGWMLRHSNARTGGNAFERILLEVKGTSVHIHGSFPSRVEHEVDSRCERVLFARKPRAFDGVGEPATVLLITQERSTLAPFDDDVAGAHKIGEPWVGFDPFGTPPPTPQMFEQLDVLEFRARALTDHVMPARDDAALVHQLNDDLSYGRSR